jgi:hypothetical protein
MLNYRETSGGEGNVVLSRSNRIILFESWNSPFFLRNSPLLSEAQMVNIYKTFAAPLSDDTLFEWQRMLMSARQELTDPGRCRASTVEPIVIERRTSCWALYA